jgi:hypothetical protein
VVILIVVIFVVMLYFQTDILLLPSVVVSPVKPHVFALLLTGQLRYLETCFPTLLGLLSRSDQFDIYATFSSESPDLTASELSSLNLLRKHGLVLGTLDYLNSSILVKRFNHVNTIHASAMQFRSGLNLVNQLYNFQKGWNLIRNGMRERKIKYSLIVKVRPDLCFSFLRPINLTELLLRDVQVSDTLLYRTKFLSSSSLNESHYHYLYFENCGHWLGGFSDQFVIGSYHIMEAYLNIIDMVDDLVFHDNIPFHAETILKAAIYKWIRSISEQSGSPHILETSFLPNFLSCVARSQSGCKPICLASLSNHDGETY